MELAQRRIWPVLFICWFVIAAALNGQVEGNLTVNTDPQGSPVVLQGDVTLAGVTPVKFSTVLSGAYKLIIDRDGFERHQQTVYLTEGHPTQLDIKLSAKTRTKALFRSLIIPGWGQKYYGSRTKGLAFFTGTVAASVGFFLARQDYNDKFDTYLEKKNARDFARVWSDLPRLNQELYDAQKDANDAENLKNIMMGTVIGIYAFNLLDAILFFPEFNTFSEYQALTVAPEMSKERVGFSVALNF